MFKKFSKYTLIGLLLLIINIGLLIYDMYNLYGMSTINELTHFNTTSRFPYLFTSLGACAVCLAIGMKVEISENDRKRREEKEFSEQEQFLEDFFFDNEPMFDKVKDKEERQLKREIVIGLLRSFHNGKHSTIFSLVNIIDKYKKKINDLQEEKNLS